MKINENFLKLQKNYLFSNIAKKVKAYKEENPTAKVISLGIGDVTRPIAPSCIAAMKKAAEELSDENTFRGYPPEYGFDFLRSAINRGDFKSRGVELSDDEIFVSDGAKSDTGNIGDIFSAENTVAVCDPVYPVYVDTNVMFGRAGNPLENGRFSNLIYMPCTAENDFCPELPSKKVDLIYICSPNNPTGTTLNKTQLKKWVDFANENGSVILFDAAYERFIEQDDVPHTIYEIEGAKSCAIEFRSFSKTAGFTGVRCGYTVIPFDLKCGEVSLNALWARRQATKFNGVSYITQRAAEAVYSEQGKKEIDEIIKYYKRNAKFIFDSLSSHGFECYGAVNSPYIWHKTPNGMTSWEYFDKLLNDCSVVGTPGSGFGPSGEGFFRLTSFGSYENTKEAVRRIMEKL